DGEIEINPKQAETQGADGHNAQLDPATGQTFTQQRARTNTHGEYRQQQGDHLGPASQHILGEIVELGQVAGSQEPEPANGQDRQQHRTVFLEGGDGVDDFGDRVPVDGKSRVRRFGFRDAPAGPIAQQGAEDNGSRNQIGACRQFEQDAAENGARQNRQESAHLYQRVAAHQLFRFQVLGQNGILGGPEEGGLSAHGKQQQHHHPDRPG